MCPSLGDIGKSTMKSINAACGFVKLKAKLEAQRDRRPDVLTPQDIAKSFRHDLFDQLFVALADGNALVATNAGFWTLS